jgi:hypothetical protein
MEVMKKAFPWCVDRCYTAMVMEHLVAALRNGIVPNLQANPNPKISSSLSAVDRSTLFIKNRQHIFNMKKQVTNKKWHLLKRQ